jgi:hypothetical protein
MYAWTLHGSFPFDSPPESVSKGTWFWGFLLSRVRDVLGGISSIPLDLASFCGPNLGYGVSMRCSYNLQSLVRIHGANREIGSFDLEELTRGRYSSWELRSWPIWPVPLTGLTGVDPWLGFARVNVLVSFLLSRVAAVSSLVNFGAR